MFFFFFGKLDKGKAEDEVKGFRVSLEVWQLRATGGEAACPLLDT
jgi:hypothetical protein